MAQESGDSAYNFNTGLLATLPPNYPSLSKSGKRRARSAKQKRLANVNSKPTLSAELPDGALQSVELGDEKHMKRRTDPVVRCWEPYVFFSCGHFKRDQCWRCTSHLFHRKPEHRCPLLELSEAGLWGPNEFCEFQHGSCLDCPSKTYHLTDGPIRYSLLIAAFKTEIQLDLLEESSEGNYKQLWMDLRLRSRPPKERCHEPLTMSDVWNFEAEFCRSLVKEKKSITPRTERRMIWHGQKILNDMCTYYYNLLYSTSALSTNTG
jgi:hypothetical protein